MFNRYLKYQDQKLKKKFPIAKIIILIVIAFIIVFGFNYAPPNFQSRGLKYLFKNLGEFTNWKDRTFLDGTVHTPETVFLKSLSLMWKTLMISITGTVMGLFMAVPLSFLAAKTTTSKNYIYLPSRIFLSLIRSIPPLMFAYLFAIYLSPSLAGVLTIAIFVATTMSKWLYEIIDTLPQEAKINFIASGGSKINAFFQVTFLQIRIRFIILAFYNFEQVIRFSSILGVVGIVGIGIMFQRFSSGNVKNWGMLGIVIMVIILTIIILEFLTFLVKKFILSYQGKIVDARNNNVNAVKLQKNYHKYFLFLLLLLFSAKVIYAFSTIVWAKTTNSIEGSPISDLLSPNWNLIFDLNDSSNPLTLAFISLGVIVVSLIIGASISLPLGLLASNKVTGKYFSLVFKFIIILIRSLPIYVWAIWTILIANQNQFAFAGALALGIQSSGMLSKLVAESANSVSDNTILSMRASGATKTQILIHAILPAIMPSLISNILYRLEINFKLLIQLGVVGASAFGFEFNIFLKNPTMFSEASAFILVNILFALIIEQISNILRFKLINGRWFQRDYKNMWKKIRIFAIRYK